MGGHGGRIGSLLLEGFAPVLGTPAAGVGRIHPDDCDPVARRHAGEPGAELPRGDASDGAAQSLSALTAAQCFPAGGSRVGEVEVLHHNRPTLVLVGAIEQRADGRTDPPVAP